MTRDARARGSARSGTVLARHRSAGPRARSPLPALAARVSRSLSGAGSLRLRRHRRQPAVSRWQAHLRCARHGLSRVPRRSVWRRASKGSADLVAYFFLRAFRPAAASRVASVCWRRTRSRRATRARLDSTSSSSEAATITRAVPSEPWPGTTSLEDCEGLGPEGRVARPACPVGCDGSVRSRRCSSIPGRASASRIV